MADAATPARAILEVRQLTIRFGDSVVLRDVNFRVEAGASVAVIGPNGSGKTVLFRALIGALPYQGDVVWAPGVRLGYVPQKLDIQRDIPVSGLDFLRARTALSGVPGNEIDAALARVGLSADSGRRPIGSLSGGQFQRLLVAFALLGNPNVLLLDEPTAGVDEPGQEHLNELIHRLTEEHGLTVLLISHELSVVYRYATMVVCLGRETVSVGPPSQVLQGAGFEALYGAPMALHTHDH